MVAALAIGVVFAATDHILRAGLMMAGAMGLGAVLRFVLPEESSGGLVVRGRTFDVTTLLLLSFGLGTISLLLDLHARP